MIVYNQSLIRPALEDTTLVRTVLARRKVIDLRSQQPLKVLLREVDHSSTLRAQVHDISNKFYHKNAEFNVHHASWLSSVLLIKCRYCKVDFVRQTSI